jgi:hypothetical protein
MAMAIALPLAVLRMISAQTLRVCREGKPASTFPDHALKVKINARFRAVLICCSAA